MLFKRKEKLIYNKIFEIENKINSLSYIYSVLNYKYEELCNDIKKNENAESFYNSINCIRSGIKISEKHFDELYKFIKTNEHDFDIYISLKTFDDICLELKKLKEEKTNLINKLNKKRR